MMGVFVNDKDTFGASELLVVIIYFSIFIVAALCNGSESVKLFRSYRRKFKISVLMLHITIVDLVVTFIILPQEILFRMQWLNGQVICKLMIVIRTFVSYLGVYILMFVALDRYLGVIYPLKLTSKHTRGYWMACSAWAIACLCTSWQMSAFFIIGEEELVVFHVGEHPHCECVFFDYFSQRQMFSYQMVLQAVIDFLPLLVIIFMYSYISLKMWKQVKRAEKAELIELEAANIKPDNNRSGDVPLRQCTTSGAKSIKRAHMRTHKKTLVVTLMTIACWTPYLVLVLWYIIDSESAKTVMNYLHGGLFTTSLAISCINPFLYGTCATRMPRSCCTYCRHLADRADVTSWYMCSSRGQGVLETAGVMEMGVLQLTIPVMCDTSAERQSEGEDESYASDLQTCISSIV